MRADPGRPTAHFATTRERASRPIQHHCPLLEAPRKPRSGAWTVVQAAAWNGCEDVTLRAKTVARLRQSGRAGMPVSPRTQGSPVGRLRARISPKR
jgi:hypothetical protein